MYINVIMSSSFQPVKCFFGVITTQLLPRDQPNQLSTTLRSEPAASLPQGSEETKTDLVRNATQQACCFGWWDAIIFCVCFLFRLFIVALKLHSVDVRLENIFHPYKIKSGKKPAGLHGGWYAPPSSCVTVCIYFMCMRIISIEHMCECVCVWHLFNFLYQYEVFDS